MALSQKHSGKILVPWFNSDEWRHVYSLLYSDNSTRSDKEEALEILKIWKIRMPILFAGLEGTLVILNAMLQDETVFSQADPTNLSSHYGLAIMRFLNLCAAHSDQQGTFFHIAKKRNLPEWLVNIRHDLAHSQKQLSLFMLRKGLEYCFQWLKREYWEPQGQEITDLIVPDLISENINRIKIYCEFVIMKISEDKLSRPMKKFLREIQAQLNSDTNIVLKKLVARLDSNKLFIEEVPNLIIEEEYLFRTLCSDIDEIPASRIEGWQPLIHYMYTNNVLMKFIRKMNEICYNNNDNYNRKLSSLWLNEIFKGLLKERGMTVEIDKRKDFLLELKELADKTIETPNIYLQNYAASLLLLCGYNKNFIDHVRNQLFNYFEFHEKLGSNDTAIFTLENVNEVVKTNIFEKLNTQPVPNADNESMKIRDTVIYEGCPIGIFPRQCQNKDAISLR